MASPSSISNNESDNLPINQVGEINGVEVDDFESEINGARNANDIDGVGGVSDGVPKNSKSILFGRIKYKNIMHIASIILEQNGTIFGGFVRDKIAHDHFAKLFYEKGGSNQDYANRKKDHSTVRRLINPKDIDCYFNKKENLDKFIEKVTLEI